MFIMLVIWNILFVSNSAAGHYFTRCSNEFCEEGTNCFVSPSACLNFLNKALLPQNTNTFNARETLINNFDACSQQLGLNDTFSAINSEDDPCNGRPASFGFWQFFHGKKKRSVVEKRHWRPHPRGGHGGFGGHGNLSPNAFSQTAFEEYLDRLNDTTVATEFRECFLAKNGFISEDNSSVATDRLLNLTSQTFLRFSQEVREEVDARITGGECSIAPEFKVLDYLRCIGGPCIYTSG